MIAAVVASLCTVVTLTINTLRSFSDSFAKGFLQCTVFFFKEVLSLLSLLLDRIRDAHDVIRDALDVIRDALEGAIWIDDVAGVEARPCV